MIQADNLQYDNGKIVTYSSVDSNTIYVWDISTGKKIFEMKIPPESYVQGIERGYVLKGGVLTVHTLGNFRRNNIPVSGTRTYSCPIR